MNLQELKKYYDYKFESSCINTSEYLDFQKKYIDYRGAIVVDEENPHIHLKYSQTLHLENLMLFYNSIHLLQASL